MSGFVQKLINLLFPPRCLGCGKTLSDEGFCTDCGSQIKSLTAPVLRDQIAFSDGLVSLYFYSGAVRRALIKMKFARRPGAAGYFGALLARKIEKVYGIGAFDGVCFVPMTAAAVKKRGYNQAELIAESVAGILGIPIVPAGIIKIKENKIQHKLSAAERRINVENAFAGLDDVRGMRLILVDDIKTTGATLCECSRILNERGAIKIVCATVAVSEKTVL